MPPELEYSEDELPSSLKVTMLEHTDTAICRRLDSPSSYLEALKLASLSLLSLPLTSYT